MGRRRGPSPFSLQKTGRDRGGVDGFRNLQTAFPPPPPGPTLWLGSASRVSFPVGCAGWLRNPTGHWQQQWKNKSNGVANGKTRECQAMGFSNPILGWLPSVNAQLFRSIAVLNPVSGFGKNRSGWRCPWCSGGRRPASGCANQWS